MKKVILYSCASVMLYLIFLSSQAQDPIQFTPANYPKIIQPSPEAAALGKYGDIPVSLYTGSIQFNVPLYTVDDGDTKFDISIDYVSSGIRVDDVATNVGLGWTLNAGGVITRAIKGIPDFINDGFPNDPNTFNPNTVTSFSAVTADYIFAKDAVLTKKDLERDIYYYNFFNNSGKFIYDRVYGATNGAPVFIPANPNLKFVPSPNQIGYGLLDDKGNRYFFEAVEGYSNVTYACIVGVQTPGLYDQAATTAWYLTKVQSPNGKEITFEYESYTYPIERSYSETKYDQSINLNGCANLSYMNASCKRIETVNGKRIKKITFNTANFVTFNYSASNRLDLNYNGQNYGNYLESIVIFNGTSVVKSWSFTYDYFSPTGSKRLKLVSAGEVGKQPYQFLYDETHSLPERLSFSQDWWGYFNGKDNSSSYIPIIHAIGRITGADKTPDFGYAKSASLTKVTYPTGGTTIFNYQPHTNKVTEQVTTYSQEIANLEVTTSYSDPNYLDFYLPPGASEVSVTWALYHTNYDDPMRAYISLSSPPLTTYFILEDNGQITNINNLQLPTDHQYRIYMERPSGTDHGYVIVKWKKPTTATVTHDKIIFGGLRIASIKNYDAPNHLADEKYYSYDELNNPGVSTALYPIQTTSEYFSNYETTEVNPEINTQYACGYLVLSSSSTPPIGSGLDGSIGYSQVVETNSVSGTNGRTLYHYSTGNIGVNLVNPGNSDWGKGLLLEKIEQKYDPQSQMFVDVHKEKNYYESESNPNCNLGSGNCTLNQRSVPNYQISFVKGESRAPAYFAVYKYFIHSFPVRIQKTEDYTYQNGITLISTEKYFYENLSYPLLVTRTEQDRSDKAIVRTYNKYPFDYVGSTDPNDAVYGSMVTNNMISPIIEAKTTLVSTTNSEKELYKKLSSYWIVGNTAQPYQTKLSELGNQYILSQTFESYDSKGNLRQFTARDGIIHTYVWGYNNTYPVAEVLGISYNTLINTVNLDQNVLQQTILSDAALRNELQKIRQAYPLNMVTTYTYKPLVGMTSQTDVNNRITYYQYDALGRLNIVMDKDHNVIKKVCYNLAGQSVSCGL